MGRRVSKGTLAPGVELSYRRDGRSIRRLTRRGHHRPYAPIPSCGRATSATSTASTFGGETVAHFVSGMEDTAAGADHWIVDLRGNGGGEVDAAMARRATSPAPGVLALP